MDNKNFKNPIKTSFLNNKITIKFTKKLFFLILSIFTIFSIYVPLLKADYNYHRKNFTFSSQYNQNLKNYTNFNENLRNRKLNIAIIGSGIGGLSTAYYLKKNKILNINKIDIYERNSRTGGRVYSEKIFNRSENLGASFFIKKNKLIFSLIEELNLKIFSTASNSDTSFGLFNNQKIFFSLGNSKFINLIKMFWRYGLSIIREKILMKNNLEKFFKIYEALNSRVFFSDVRQLINHIGLEDLVTQTIKRFLKEKNVDEKYIDEFANLLLKIIYNQENDINAFAGFITLIGGSYESFRIEGGNYELIKKLVDVLTGENKYNNFNLYKNDTDRINVNFENDAKVTIKKNTNVLKIVKKYFTLNNEFDEVEKHDRENHRKNFDSFEFYTIEFQNKSQNEEEILENKATNNTNIDKNYKNLNRNTYNKTIINDNNNNFDEDNNSNEIYFEDYDIVVLASPLENSKIEFPKDIELNNTNLIPKKNYYYFINGKLKNNIFDDFDSLDLPSLLISYNKSNSHNILYIKQLNDNLHRDQFKINSDEILNSEDFEFFFNSNYTIIYRNHWEMAYPQLLPRGLDTLPSFQLSENLYYLNAIESIGSCMELSMISAKNIVNLIENKYFPFKENNNFKTEEF